MVVLESLIFSKAWFGGKRRRGPCAKSMCIRNGTVNTCYDEQKPPCVRDHFCNPDFFVLAAMSQSAPKKKQKKIRVKAAFSIALESLGLQSMHVVRKCVHLFLWVVCFISLNDPLVLSSSSSPSGTPRRGNSSSIKQQRSGGSGEPSHIPAWLSFPPIAASLRKFQNRQLNLREQQKPEGSLAVDALSQDRASADKNSVTARRLLPSFLQSSFLSIFSKRVLEFGRALCVATISSFAASRWIKMMTDTADAQHKRFMSLPSVVSWFQPKCLMQVSCVHTCR
jgi:hypothetical protein